MKWIIREQQRCESDFNAGSKARADVDAILIDKEFQPLISSLEIDTSQNPLKKVFLHYTRYSDWRKSLKRVKSGDTVVVQYPIRNHTVLFSLALKKIKKAGVRTICVIHDLESLRNAIDSNVPKISKLRFSVEEVSVLKYFTMIIVHNQRMKNAIHEMFQVPMKKMVSLNIFDYLYQKKDDKKAFMKYDVIIAGNLDKNKAGYIYHLPSNIPISLYGANIDESFQFSENITYKGKVPPDDLPSVLKGSFGLVWDGPSADTCEGVFGEYLKVNNPHKASLYLAAGLPLIVWSQSALADYVKKHQCGIFVDSLCEIESILKTIDDKQYDEIVRNANELGKQIRNGQYLRKALQVIENRLK